MNLRERLKDKQRIVIKVGSSSLVHEETGALNLTKLEILVREISDIRNMGKEVILVSSGAIAVGAAAAKLAERPGTTEEKQACAAIGQGRLMMIYQKLFMEYNQLAAQILMTKNTVLDNLSRHHALNTFRELLYMGAIPIVNENDTVATYEIHFGDNDSLSAIVAALVDADLLILLSDIDGRMTQTRTPTRSLLISLRNWTSICWRWEKKAPAAAWEPAAWRRSFRQRSLQALQEWIW